MMGLMLIHLAFAACDFPISCQIKLQAGSRLPWAAIATPTEPNERLNQQRSALKCVGVSR